jgi:hypothetical protein
MEGSPTGARRRRMLVAATAAVAVPLVVASVAWACVLQQGTVLVCNPPSQTYVNGTQCAKISGSGSQAGLPKVSRAGATISVRAYSFADRPYNVNFRAPGGPGCYQGGNQTLGSAQGPSFYLGSLTTPAITGTGRAQVCVAQMPVASNGNTINVTVI